MQELIQALQLEKQKDGDDFFLRTIADGNCGPRSVIQILLIQGFLRNNRGAAWKAIYTICTGDGHNLPENPEFDEFKKRFVTAETLKQFSEFMSVYCAPAGDPELRHEGDGFFTALSALLRDKIIAHSEDVISLMSDDSQATVGINLDMCYGIIYFKEKLGINLVIKYRNDPNRITTYSDAIRYRNALANDLSEEDAHENNNNEEDLNLTIICDTASAHFDALVLKADLEAYYNLNLNRETDTAPHLPTSTALIFRPIAKQPQQLALTIIKEEGEFISMMHQLNDLFISKKYKTVTIDEVQSIVSNTFELSDTINMDPFVKLVDAVNEQNKMTSVLGYSNPYIDLICNFILRLFKADRSSVILKVCDEFKNSLAENIENTNRLLLTN